MALSCLPQFRSSVKLLDRATKDGTYSSPIIKRVGDAFLRYAEYEKVCALNKTACPYF